MAQQKKGLIARLLEGKERSEEYARNSLPTSRWQLFFDIFKNNFSKLVKVNLLMLLFFVPMIAIIIVYFLMGDVNANLYPFGANLGVGYPVAPSQNGLSEGITMTMGYVLYIGLFVTSFISAIGLAGGMYVIRNMVWTEGIFVASDFWRGVKRNYKNALQALLVFVCIFTLADILINMGSYTLAVAEVTGGMKTWLVISQVLCCTMILFVTMIAFWMVALGVNYEYSFFALLRNAGVITIGVFPQTVFFLALGLAPYLILSIAGQFLVTICVTVIIFFGFAYTLLVWLDFAQWVFDKFINPKIAGAKVGKGLYNPAAQPSESQSEATIEYQRSLVAFGKSRLVAKPIKPIDDDVEVYELPQSFTREDLQRLRESKRQMEEDSKAYSEEHKEDERYVEYNKQFDDLAKSLEEHDQEDEKKKKKHSKLLGK